MHKIKLEQFEGPLDLLLLLIEQQKFDITKISLAEATDQYIEYLNQAKNLSLGELADFLVIATKLLLIKSKALLPFLNPEEEEEIQKLEEQLKIYKEYFDASKKINEIILKRNFSFTREKALNIMPIFSPPKSLNKNLLAEIFTEVLNDLEAMVHSPAVGQTIMKKIFSLQEKIEHIKNLIFEKSKLSFNHLINSSKSKIEIIVSFLALLELIKQKHIIVIQEENFEEIIIQKTSD
ncbi:segregation/condensation protein A [Candidatus Kuenenbacteria bacterium]|nr:segregation/condensation protein A [Candidatus Kuenenbacteria bacterium]